MYTFRNILTLFLLTLTTAIWAQEESIYKHDDRYSFIVVTKDTVKDFPPMSDEEFYGASSGVVFETGVSNISANDSFIEMYRNEVLPYINSGHLQLRKIFVRGAASPEGSYATNKKLGILRSQALLDEIKRDLRFQYTNVDAEVSNVIEDYTYLCLLMRNASDPDYALVKKYFDETGGDEVKMKTRLKAAKGGALWQRLLKEYFPQLRSARLILWFAEPDKEHTPIAELPIPDFGRHYLIPVHDSLDSQRIDPVYERRHLVALRTNLLYDAFYMPGFGFAPMWDAQLEYYPLDSHYTFNLEFTNPFWQKWDSHQFFQFRDYRFELRRYFRKKGDYTGFYASTYVENTVFGIGLSNTKGWQGEGAGAGLQGGYVLPVNRKGDLRLEFHAGLGFFYTLFDPYVYGNPVTGVEDGLYYYDFLGSANKFKERNHSFSWFGPTSLGVSLTYDILYRRNKTIKEAVR